MYTGVSGTALSRAAQAMLRSLGGVEIGILFPVSPIGADTNSQLGMTDLGTEEVRLSPVITRTLATENSGPRRRLELLIPASAVMEEMQSRGIITPERFFDSALCVNLTGELFHVEGMATEYFAGVAYLFRLVVVE